MNTEPQDSETVTAERVGTHDAVLLLTLTRTHKANAYTQKMLAELHDAVRAAEGDDSLRTIVVAAAGDGAFCAGADHQELDARRWADAINLASRRVFDALACTPLPTIAAVGGAAVGGGFELALACDLRVCSKVARFGFPEVDHGLIPAAGGCWRLAQHIGLSRAREIVVFGKQLDAEEAFAWGLVSHVGEDFMQAALTSADNAAKRDPAATQMAKLALCSAGIQQFAPFNEAATQALLYERRAVRRENRTRQPSEERNCDR